MHRKKQGGIGKGVSANLFYPLGQGQALQDRAERRHRCHLFDPGRESEGGVRLPGGVLQKHATVIAVKIAVPHRKGGAPLGKTDLGQAVTACKCACAVVTKGSGQGDRRDQRAIRERTLTERGKGAPRGEGHLNQRGAGAEGVVTDLGQ